MYPLRGLRGWTETGERQQDRRLNETSIPGCIGNRRSTPLRGRMSTAMTKRDVYKNRIKLVQDTLDMLLLRTLQWGPQLYPVSG
jgi:hypothetical protein